jgi:hypothetical protein
VIRDPKTIRTILEMNARGIPLHEISASVVIGQTAISYLLQDLKLPEEETEGPPAPPAEQEEDQEDYRQPEDADYSQQPDS